MCARILFLAFLHATTLQLYANIRVAGPTNFRDTLPTLVAGDTLYLIPGNYTQSLRIENLNGTLQHPIMIAGQPGQAKPIFVGNSCCNTISLKVSSFLHLKNLVCDGQGIVGIDAVKAEGNSSDWTHHIELEGLEIYNYGADQQNVGISTKCPSWDWWVHHNEIIAAGTGMYFGNSDGEQPFVNSIVEYNLVLNTIGYNCQVKHQNLNTRNLTLGMPASGKTVIRYNVFSKEQNASSGNLARPNLLVGNFPASGNGSADYYEIYGNLFFQNPNEALFQGTGNLGFYNNLLYNSLGGSGISVQTHNGFQPRDIDVFFNTVVVSGDDGISISGINSSYVQGVWANAVFAQVPITGGQQSMNVSGTFIQASQSLNSTSLPIANLDLAPMSNMLTITGINLNVFSHYTDFDVDFDGITRDGLRAGAYVGSTTRWPLQMAIRTPVESDVVNPNTQILLKSSSISLYPCPAQTYVQIEGALNNYQLRILDVNGAVHETISNVGNLTSIDVQSLPSGIFFISILNTSNNELQITKMIKEQ